MHEFTPAQKQAIYTRGCDLLVSAAAGSGKTAVLSERVLQMITDESCPVDIDRFLIVTFTNAAAAEMKERISKKISDLLDKKNISKYMVDRLQRQLVLVGKASITTIHSFCLDIIRNNFHLVDIDPGFRISEENETQLLKLQMADKMLETMYGGSGADIFSRLCIWLGNGKDENLIESILRIYNFIQSFPLPFEWLHNQVEKYNPDELVDSDCLEWIAEMKQSYAIRLSSIHYQCKELIDFANENGAEFYCATLEDDLQQIDFMLKLCNKNWEDLYAAASNFSFSRLKGKPRDSDPEVTGYVLAQRNNIKDVIKKIVSEITSMSPATIIEGLKRAYPLLLCLEESILMFHNLYTDKKRSDGILDFNDFEHIALSILSDEENNVAASFRDKFVEIFVDEYQDCNMTQEELFLRICRKKDGIPCNMFMVGDVKQSIYKFRQADPTIFMQKNKSYKIGRGVQQKVILNKNFRSSHVILDCINNIFSRIMSEYAGEITYDDDEKLFYRSNILPPITDKDKCELLIAQPEDTNNEEFPESNLELESRMVANRILSLRVEGYNFKDIVVLLRGLSTRSNAFEEEFKKRGIPFYMDGGTGYFESLEIRIFISLLKVIDNPLQDIPLVGLLRSPLFCFDENELLKIRLAKKGMFYNAMIKYASTEDGGKCRDFLNKLNKWRDTSVSMQVNEFLDYIINETNLYDFVAALPNGDQRKANLNLLIERSKSLQNSGFNGLFNYINFVEKLKRHSDTGLAKRLPENSDVVRIMTIHKSKGLEFPVVFLSSCHSHFNTSDSKGSLLLHRNLGIGADFIDSERKIKYSLVSKSAIAERIRIENVSEEMRVLYVALTRAKQKLICTSVVKNAEEKKENWESMSLSPSPLPAYFTSGANCYLDWISSSLNENWIIKILSPKDIQSESNVVHQPALNINNQTTNINVSEILEYQYPQISATKLPTKFSVSEIKRRFDFEDITSVKLYTSPLIKAPRFIKSEEITPAQAGIINHLILKEMPLKALSAEDVLDCAHNLIKKGLLLETELKYIQIDAIQAFSLSNLGLRLIESPKVYREIQFNIRVPAKDLFPNVNLSEETVLVQGIIDCMFEENGKVVIIDFKTDRFLRPESKEMYSIQLNTYAKAAKALTKLDVSEKYLYMLSQKTSVLI